MECWGEHHWALAGMSFCGLFTWCFGLPLALFARIFLLGQNRQDHDNHRRYGYFIQGLEPRFWYWDLVVKRADIGMMLVVAYTSIANDAKAKLLLFPIISGRVSQPLGSVRRSRFSLAQASNLASPPGSSPMQIPKVSSSTFWSLCCCTCASCCSAPSLR